MHRCLPYEVLAHDPKHRNRVSNILPVVVVAKLRFEDSSACRGLSPAIFLLGGPFSLGYELANESATLPYNSCVLPFPKAAAPMTALSAFHVQPSVATPSFCS